MITKLRFRIGVEVLVKLTVQEVLQKELDGVGSVYTKNGGGLMSHET